jgi:hypothetical protein
MKLVWGTYIRSRIELRQRWADRLSRSNVEKRATSDRSQRRNCAQGAQAIIRASSKKQSEKLLNEFAGEAYF